MNFKFKKKLFHLRKSEIGMLKALFGWKCKLCVSGFENVQIVLLAQNQWESVKLLSSLSMATYTNSVTNNHAK